MFILYSLSVIIIDVVIMFIAIYSFIIESKQPTRGKAFDICLFLFAVIQLIGSLYYLIKHLNP